MKKRVMVSKTAIESPNENLEVLSDLVSTGSQDGLRRFEVGYILRGFNEDVRGRDGFVTPAEMHRCLAILTSRWQAV